MLILLGLKEHCLDLFREAAICRGDTALTTFEWEERQAKPVALFKTDHQCVDWEELEKWSKEHSITIEMLLSLRNPLL